MNSPESWVIIIGASDLVFPAYVHAREDLGHGIIAFDMDVNAPGMRYADIAVEVSTKDVDKTVEQARELASRHHIAGVFTCGADVEITVAAIAEELKLPGIPLSVARDCNDKIRMHQCLDALDFHAKARYRVINSAEELDEAIAFVGLPCVIKPVSNCASRGVQRIDAAHELRDAFHLARQFNLGDDKQVIVEQCLEGSKHTVEMIAYDENRQLLSIIDTHYISPRWPCETKLTTTLLSEQKQRECFEFAKNVAGLIGIDFGAHKVDINIDRDGSISLIELTARLSGGFHCQYASPLAYGSRDILAALKLAVGMPLDMDDIAHRWNKGAVVMSVFPEPGVITKIDGVDLARSQPGVAEVFVIRKLGDRIGPYYNSADRVAFVIAEGDSVELAEKNALRGVNLIGIETRTT